MFELKPVVEAPMETSPFWCPLPQRPWESLVVLGGSSTDEEVGLVLLQLATYNCHEKTSPLSPGELMKETSLVLPGGLLARADGRSVAPSCCSGLENWTEWQVALSDGSSPWMGHDPSPWLEVQDDYFYLWPDTELPADERDTLAIRFSRSELHEQLSLVAKELVAFTRRVREVVAYAVPDHSHGVAMAFERSFLGRR